MSAVFNNNSSAPVIPSPRTSSPTGPSPAPGSGTPGESNVDQGSISRAFAASELAYAMAGVDGTDWNALQNDLATASGPQVSIAAVMVLLIQVMSEMRQAQREESLAEAQNALALGLDAANKLKSAALTNLIGGLVSSSVSALSAAVSMYGASQSAKAGENAKAKLTEGEQRELKGLQTKSESAGGLTSAEKSRLQTLSDRQEYNTLNGKKINGETLTAEEKSRLDTLEGKLSGNAQALMRQMDINNQGMTQLINTLGQIGSTIAGYVAATEQAESKAVEAQAQYVQSRQQVDQQFFDQLGQAIKALLDSWKSTESATHQASQAIYNV